MKKPLNKVQNPPQAALAKLQGLYQKKRFPAVVSGVKKLIAKYPNSLALWHYLGGASMQTGQVSQAVLAYRNATKLAPADPVVYHLLGSALRKAGQREDAAVAFDRAIRAKPDYIDAHLGLGHALRSLGKLDPAVRAYQAALAVDASDVRAHQHIGDIHQQLLQFDAAIASYHAVLSADPTHFAAYFQLSSTLQKQGDWPAAIDAAQKAVGCEGDSLTALVKLLHQLQHTCDWDTLATYHDANDQLDRSPVATSTFELFSRDDSAARQFARAQKWAKQKYKAKAEPLAGKPAQKSQKLRVGYFGGDFHRHPSSSLLSGVLREHDKTHFEIFIYSFGPDSDDPERHHAIACADEFHDVSKMADVDVVALARRHKIDIAIELTGYTTYSRAGLLQYRLAPVQINYLGYPGTLGASFVDYIIADETVIPENRRQYFAEAPIYLPNSYLPFDNANLVPAGGVTRKEHGLPEDAVVLCCLNNNYKISPVEFDIWMDALHAVENSVLWLLSTNKWAEANLRKAATARGLNPDRLIFARRVDSAAAHIARQTLADLFLDTFNYNAHTTTSEALWAGLPVVTKQGDQFSARVASSLLRSADLPELITTSNEAYGALIIALAKDPARLRRIREKLQTQRNQLPLFDTIQYTRDLEKGLQLAYDRYFDGRPVGPLWVT